MSTSSLATVTDDDDNEFFERAAFNICKRARVDELGNARENTLLFDVPHGPGTEGLCRHVIEAAESICLVAMVICTWVLI